MNAKPTARAAFLLLALLVTAGLTCCGDASAPSQAAASPEHELSYAVSHILFTRDPNNPAATMAKALAALDELRSGAGFAEMARRRSDNDRTGSRGGWLGFMQLQDQDTFTGAVQGLPHGAISGPVSTEKGLHIIKRHTFAEARAIEQRLAIPAYGFFVPWAKEAGAGPSKEEARQQAQQARAQVVKGELTLEAAAKRYSPIQPPRSDLFIANVYGDGNQRSVHEVVSRVGPGEVAELAEVPGAFVVVQRGTYLRSHVRHILVQHVDAPNRPLAVSRTKDEARAAAEKALAELGGDVSKWSGVVRRYSDEIGTVPLNGWMGSVTNGQLLPEMEALLQATAPGTIADRVVESSDGFHVLYRVD